MKRKLSRDLWFVCDECGTEYDNDLEKIDVSIHPQEIIDWAYKPTTNENYIDAIEKAIIRGKHENKKCESKG